MQRRHRTTLIAFQLIALQLFAALAFAAPVKGSQLTRASGAASFDVRTPNASSVQRRRRGRRRRTPDALMPGVWGGQHIRFEVNAGGATMDFDCAHGSVDGKIPVDSAGRFNVAGTYYQEHGGPVREGAGSNGQPVRLTGRVGGSIMSLTITHGRTQVGTYNLTRDNEGRIFKCR